MKWNDKLLFHDRQQGFRHHLARFFGRDSHEQAPLPVRHELGPPRDPFPRAARRRQNRARERARAVTRSRGQVMRS